MPEQDTGQLACGTIVYRAILRKDWFDPDRINPRRVKAEAFFRRRPREVNGTTDPRDSDGLSVSMASMVEPNQFGLTFSTCYGVASLHVGRLLDLGIKVISDPEDPSKLLLANVPFENPGEPQLEKLAGDIAKSARIVEVFNPPLENKRNG